ncbi:MAG: class I SAM-dependent methyltransferase, partial [Pseudomonadota bacterium]|nr:class I SAM-dependent methyltransferase [Pseudomonadota bacterium]
MHALSDQLQAAHDRRQPWLAGLEDTSAYRLFHGAVEGTPGLTVDRYGPVLLVQSFRAPLDPAARGALDAFAATLPEIEAVAWNHRGRPKVEPEPLAGAALEPHTILEEGLRFAFQARHRGIDPWLFLDFRAGRRRVRAEAAGKRVLNLFAYTCTMGVAAAAAGA